MASPKDFVRIVSGRKFTGQIKRVMCIEECRDIYGRLICHYYKFVDGTKVQCIHCEKVSDEEAIKYFERRRSY